MNYWYRKLSPVALVAALLTVGMAFAQEEGGEQDLTPEQAEIQPIDVDTVGPEDTTLVGTDDNPKEVEPEAKQNTPPVTPPKRIAIRYFLLQGGGTRAYEIRRGSKTGGRFKVFRAAKGKVGNIPILGYTDRASAGEMVMVHIGGGSSASLAAVKFGRSVRVSAKNINLPYNFKRTVNPVAGTSIFTYVVQDGKKPVVKRLPVGPRPNR